ncbi:MAG: hypothetical protein WKI04_11690 [Ferruginibacter sp.]
MGLNIAGIIADGVIKDTSASYIYKQNPQAFDDEKRPVYIRPGQLMDLYISPERILPAESADTIQ